MGDERNRTRQLNLMLRLNEDERAMIEGLARAQGLTKADAMRQALRRDAKRLGVDAAKAKKGRRS